jgi:hypothetical protein
MAIPPELMASASEVTKLSKLSVYRGGRPERAARRPRSRPSSQILWRGTHWCVTNRGIESLDGRHFLDRLRLTDKDAIDIAAGGGWDHPDDFADAWRAAAKIFREACLVGSPVSRRGNARGHAVWFCYEAASRSWRWLSRCCAGIWSALTRELP